MKEKIFQLLKTTYSSLGLGDAVLSAHAQVLDSMGVVTDENINAVIANQKAILESFQKHADERATTAQKKAVEKLNAELEALKGSQTASAEEKQKLEAKIKEMEEKLKGNGGEDPKPSFKLEDDETFKSVKESFDQKTKSLEDTLKKLTENLTSLQSENNKYKAEKALAERNQFITSKAKELGVPEWRIAEGFSLASDANEETIVNHLTQVANNIKAQVLPDKKTSIPMGGDNKVDPEFTKGVASSLLKAL